MIASGGRGAYPRLETEGIASSIIAMATSFAVLIWAMAEARGIRPLYSEVTRRHGANRCSVFRGVVLPGSPASALALPRGWWIPWEPGETQPE